MQEQQRCKYSLPIHYVIKPSVSAQGCVIPNKVMFQYRGPAWFKILVSHSLHFQHLYTLAWGYTVVIIPSHSLTFLQ